MLKVKLLNPKAKVPTRANPTDAGLDLYAFDTCKSIEQGERCLIGTGIAISIPTGYMARILPRSGLAVKNGIDTLAGLIDSSYTGEIMVALLNTSKAPFSVKKDDRIAQLVIQKVELWNPVVVEELDETERGESGFGSSGQ
jgi:dUTP diphosphatase